MFTSILFMSFCLLSKDGNTCESQTLYAMEAFVGDHSEAECVDRIPSYYAEIDGKEVPQGHKVTFFCDTYLSEEQ